MGFKNWFKNPTILYHWPSFIDYIMFIDENGTSELKGVRKRLRSGTEPSLGERLFTVSGVIIKRQDFPAIRNRFVTIKNTHWENGLFYYPKEQRLKRVCFKSNDIRNRTGPFSEAVINYQAFTNDLVSLVIESPYTIISANMDKLNHVNKYGSYACNPYDLCLTSIVERFSKFILMPQKASGVLVLESRGEKEDKGLLNYLSYFLATGQSPSGKYVTPKELSFIKGVFFNPKWCSEENELKSYFGLELSDLVSYPIHKYCRTGVKDKSFLGIEHKLYCYPDYYQRGLKKFF